MCVVLVFTGQPSAAHAAVKWVYAPGNQGTNLLHLLNTLHRHVNTAHAMEDREIVRLHSFEIPSVAL
jgi:hypothetical protein